MYVETGFSSAKTRFDVFQIVRMLGMNTRILADAAAELFQSVLNRLPRCAAAAHVVQSDLETFPVELVNPLQVIGILKGRSPKRAPGAAASGQTDFVVLKSMSRKSRYAGWILSSVLLSVSSKIEIEKAKRLLLGNLLIFLFAVNH